MKVAITSKAMIQRIEEYINSKEESYYSADIRTSSTVDGQLVINYDKLISNYPYFNRTNVFKEIENSITEIETANILRA